MLPSLRVPVAANCCVVPLAMEKASGATAIETKVALSDGRAWPCNRHTAGSGRDARRPCSEPTCQSSGVMERWPAVSGVPRRRAGEVQRVVIGVRAGGNELLERAGGDQWNGGVGAIETNVAAVTVNVAGLLVIRPVTAVMADVPAATPLARPAVPIVAIPGVPEFPSYGSLTQSSAVDAVGVDPRRSELLRHSLGDGRRSSSSCGTLIETNVAEGGSSAVVDGDYLPRRIRSASVRRAQGTTLGGPFWRGKKNRPFSDNSRTSARSQ